MIFDLLRGIKLPYAGPQLHIAKGADHGNNAGQHPNDHRGPDGLDIVEDAGGGDEDAGADDPVDDVGRGPPGAHLVRFPRRHFNEPKQPKSVDGRTTICKIQILFDY